MLLWVPVEEISHSWKTMFSSFHTNRRRVSWNRGLQKSLIKVCSRGIWGQFVEVVEFELCECDVEVSVEIVVEAGAGGNLEIVFRLSKGFGVKFAFFVLKIVSFLFWHESHFLDIVSSSWDHETVAKSVRDLSVFLKLKSMDHKSVNFRIHWSK